MTASSLRTIRSLAGMLIAFALALGAASAILSRASAEPQPPLDRVLVDRLVRAQETQARALEALVRATEKCSKR